MRERDKRHYCVCPLARRQVRPIAYGLPSDKPGAMPGPDVMVGGGCVVGPERWWCVTCHRPLDPEREPTSEEIEAAQRRVEEWEQAHPEDEPTED